MDYEKEIEPMEEKKCIPCKCGKMFHRKDAVYCGHCGNVLEKKSSFRTKILIWMLESWMKQN